MIYRFACRKRKNANKPNKNKGNQAAINGGKVDLLTKTPKILSKKINRKPKLIPKAKFTPIPPLLLNEETATAIIVNIKAEIGMLHRLWRTNK